MAKDGSLIKAIAVGLCAGLVITGGCYVALNHEKIFNKQETEKPAPTPDNPDNPDDPGVTLTYEVKFKNGDTEITQTVEAGGLIQPPENPTIEGHDFLGWAFESDPGTIIDAQTFVVTENITFIAVFVPLAHTMIIEIDGEQITQEVEFGQALNLETPTKEGHTFKGWSVNGEIVDLTTFTVTENVTITALFEINTYTVTLEIDDSQTTQTVNHGEILSLEDPIKEGYTFDGWSLDGTNIVDLATYPITEETTLIALFTKNVEYITDFTFTDGQVTSYSGTATNVTIPSSYSLDDEGNAIVGNDIQVTSLGKSLFSSKQIVNVTIPYGVTSIESKAFYYCTKLKSITIPDSVTSLGSEVFCYCVALESVKFSSNMTYIPTRAFQDCNSLVNIILPDNIKTLSQGAFMNCKNLKTIDLGSITKTQQQVFKGCTALESITIPAGLTNIGTNNFDGCTALKNIVVEEGNTVYDSRDNCNAIILTASNTIYRGGINTVIPSTVTTIGQYAFDSSGLTGLTIPDSVTAIYGYAFNQCKSLTSIVVPDSVQSIGNCAFSGCEKLKTVTIGSGATSIGTSVFSYSTAITQITFKPTTPPTITADIIPNTTCKIYVPDEALETYKTATYYSTHASQFYAMSELEEA